MANFYLGLSGFSYKEWQGEGRFYPAELKAKEFFAYYAERYNAVEMDGTWYRMPSEAAVEQWMKQCADEFKYTFKAHRTVTHVKRLKREEAFDGIKFQAKRLKPMLDCGKCGAVFLQMPPSFKRNDTRVDEFFSELPKDIPWAIEFRHESWDNDESEAMLKKHNVALVSWDTEDADGIRRDTGPFIYARMRREEYTDEKLQEWAEWFKAGLANGKDVYCFFKHEDDGSPWLDAERLRKMMDL